MGQVEGIMIGMYVRSFGVACYSGNVGQVFELAFASNRVLELFAQSLESFLGG